MGLFSRYNPGDRIYISALEYENERPPEGKVQVLFCDSKGNLTTSTIDISIFEIAQNSIVQLSYEGKGGAALMEEIAPGQSVTFAVEINAEQAEALEQLKESAFETGTVPHHLEKYPQQIIKQGENTRKELERRYKRGERLLIPLTPDLVEHLMSNPDTPVHVEFHSGKADMANPFIFLRKLPPNEQTQVGMQRTLVLDYEGTLGIVRIPTDVLNDAENEFEHWRNESNEFGVIVFWTRNDGISMGGGPMQVRESQKKALDAIEAHWEKTQSSPMEIPLDVQAMLVKAKTLMFSGSLENTNS